MTKIAFSLTRGGPFYRLLRRLQLVRHDGRDLLRQSCAIVGVSWLPLQVLALFDGASSAASGSSIWHALALHVRFLVALPLLLASEELLESLCRSAIDSVGDDRFGRGTRRRVERCARAAERLRDSTGAELALITCLLAFQLLVWSETGEAALMRDHDFAGTPPAAAIWHALVALPLVNFLLLRWLWRWVIWSWLLCRVSRLRLEVIASHPDGAGGLARLAEPTLAIAMMLGGLSAVLAASWGNEVVHARIGAASHIVHAVAIVAIGLLLALGPLFVFVRLLVCARFEAGCQYSRFALDYTRAFHERWIVRGERDGLLGTPDVSGLADLIASVEHVGAMRAVPFDRTRVAIVAGAIVAPMTPLPLIAAGVPLQDLLQRTLLSLLLGS